MKDGHASHLTESEKSNHIKVDQTYLVQIQRDARSAGPHLRLQFSQVLPSNSTDQPNGGFLRARISLNSERHHNLARIPLLQECKISAIRNAMILVALAVDDLPSFQRLLKLQPQLSARGDEHFRPSRLA